MKMDEHINYLVQQEEEAVYNYGDDDEEEEEEEEEEELEGGSGDDDDEDGEYEFEAFRFFDFLREEYDWEIEEAERWFEVSGDYEPSPFIVKLNMEKLFPKEVVQNATKSKASSNKKPWSGVRHGLSTSKETYEGRRSQMNQDAAKNKTRPSADKSFQPRISTLMKPTASHLAKQNKLPDDYKRTNLSTRSGRASSNLSEKSSTSSVRIDNFGTKRQKLEMGGYLRKMAHLKHHISFLHKSSKKVTVPREPELETLLRAQRRSSKHSSVSSDNEKDGKRGSNFKAVPLNKKILQAPSSPQTRKGTKPVTQSHIFRLMTMERANHRAVNKASKLKDVDLRAAGATDSKRRNFRETSKLAKQNASPDSEANPHVEEEPELPTDGQLDELPPIEQFAKLSLGPSDSEESNASQSESNTSRKDVKENADNVPDLFQSEFWPSQCGDHLIVPEASWSNLNRRLDIR